MKLYFDCQSIFMFIDIKYLSFSRFFNFHSFTTISHLFSRSGILYRFVILEEGEEFTSRIFSSQIVRSFCMGRSSSSMGKVPVITSRICSHPSLRDFSLLVIAKAGLGGFFRCSSEVYNNNCCSLSPSIMIMQRLA
ncbi:hypothetical protein HN51_055030 [Arachis hypogaea]|uniref:Uncharacterized protein n=1 Tax=Arachis hypogaea TaxID=3818 RepID=A0A6B9V8K2_ARAHY|nr:uncharacterized protein LOC107616816 [Arachis ipaensis]XP_025677060.1 uncharacterized protein LOC112776991 [Arachis hypogaea]QHN77673.1 uncharacterized protein DS421_19g654750 [Arachis hypogaea]